jgi:hypothetical protein
MSSTITDLTTCRPWLALQKQKGFDDDALVDAMDDVARLEKERVKNPADLDSAALYKAVRAVSVGAESAAKRCDKKTEGAIVKALEELGKLADLRMKEIMSESQARTRARKDREDDDGSKERGNVSGDADAVRSQMRALAKENLAFAFGVGADGGTAQLIFHRRVQGASLARILLGHGCKKATYGEASAKGPALQLRIDGPALSGLAALVKAYLADNAPMPCSSVTILKSDGAAEDVPAKPKAGARTQKQVSTNEDGDVVVDL